MRTVLIPGFTQTLRSWDGVIQCAPAIDANAVDVPVRESFDATITALAGAAGSGVWCGYSMGGRLALATALTFPWLVDQLVLVSGSPGLRTEVERGERRAADEHLAQSALSNGTAQFLERWLGQPMFRSVPPNAPGLQDRASLTPERIAHDLRALGTGSMPNLWDRLIELIMPVVIVTGTHDTKFTAIGMQMCAAIPHARHVQLDCGHAIPLEQPQQLANILHDTHNAAARNNDETI